MKTEDKRYDNSIKINKAGLISCSTCIWPTCLMVTRTSEMGHDRIGMHSPLDFIEIRVLQEQALRIWKISS